LRSWNALRSASDGECTLFLWHCHGPGKDKHMQLQDSHMTFEVCSAGDDEQRRDEGWPGLGIHPRQDCCLTRGVVRRLPVRLCVDDWMLTGPC
jgi:hypothetical protein